MFERGGAGRGLDLFTCGRGARSCDLNPALGRATAVAGLTPLNLRAKRDGQVAGLRCLGPSRKTEAMASSHAYPQHRTRMGGFSRLSPGLRTKWDFYQPDSAAQTAWAFSTGTSEVRGQLKGGWRRSRHPSSSAPCPPPPPPAPGLYIAQNNTWMLSDRGPSGPPRRLRRH